MSKFGLRRKLQSLKKKSTKEIYPTASHSDSATPTQQPNIDTSPTWVARNQLRLYYQTALYPPVGPTLADAPNSSSVERPTIAYPEYLARRLRRRDGCAEGVLSEDDKVPQVLVTVIGYHDFDDLNEQDDLIEVASFI